jgi:hypothetical protein
LTAANFLATESAQCQEGWHHQMRLVETLSTVCRMPAWPLGCGKLIMCAAHFLR